MSANSRSTNFPGATGVSPVPKLLLGLLPYVVLLAISTAHVTAAEPAATTPPAEDAEFFEKDVRPLLIARCYKCHGDVLEPKGGLSLTSRDAVLKGGQTGPAAVAGKPQESLLIEAIHYDGLEMPPEGDRLSAVEIARLERWVERGLPWPKSDARALAAGSVAAEDAQIAAARAGHWSFQPIKNPRPPAVRDASWPRTTIDQFILAELESRGMRPSPPADRRTLLRRLSFDLIGLPPTPEEMAEFLGDPSADAIARVVDRLLASPRYGERWGRHWLDVARYADTKGYVLFQEGDFPWSYTYRDYVVRALNADLPYNRFLLEQLAADKLPLGDDKRPLAALGFLTVGSRFMNNQQDVFDDRIDVVTRGLLGLTVSCARCHDHKFDPIPTRDYYSLYGVFAGSIEPTVPPLFEPPPRTEAYEKFAAELSERERKLNEYVEGKFHALVEGARTRVAEYLLAAHALKDQPTTEDFMLLADGNDLNPTMIIRYQVYLARSRGGHDPVLAIWNALAELPDDRFSAEAAGVVARAIAAATPEQPINPLVVGAFLGKPLKDRADAARIYGELLLGADKVWQATLAQAKAAAQPLPPALADANLEALRQVLYAVESPAGVARSEITELMLLPDRDSQNERNKLLKAIEEWRASGPAAPPRAMVLEDLTSPPATHVFVRGNPNQLGDQVPRRFVRVLCDGPAPTFGADSGRLDLARAITARDNPLTARVIVNRVWLDHFGQALVRTPSDFGLRSQPPTHPALLDFLAWNFMERGWSLKQLHREIVLSAVYRQAGNDRPECRAADPENVWLWKMNRRRLDFESTRDALLAVSGRLETTLGGPPVKNIADPAATRRTLYGYIDRLNLPGLYRTFDFPNTDATSPERVATTIPQQALFLMNSPIVQASAKNLLARADVAAAVDADKKVERMYQIVLGREPGAEELTLARQFLSDAAARPAAWEEFAQGLLLTNEFVFVD